MENCYTIYTETCSVYIMLGGYNGHGEKKGVVVAGERGEILYKVVRKNLTGHVICE